MGKFAVVKAIGVPVLMAAAGALSVPAALAQVRDLDEESSDIRVFQGEVAGAPALFQITVPADTGLQIDVLATDDDLDPVLRVLESDGTLIAEDDDGGELLNSRVRIGAESRTRRITIEVDGFSGDWAEAGESYGGSFDLRIATSDFVDVGTRPVSFGSSETGVLSGDEHLFTIAGQAGEVVEIALVSTDGELDPYLELRGPGGEAVASDDDGGQDVNSLLRHAFEQDGTYTIAASGFGDSQGAYRLRIRERQEMSAQLPLQVIGLADEANGELVGSWDETGSTSLVPAHIDYQLSDAARDAIRAGEGEVTIRMMAREAGDPDFGDAIDSYIELGFETPLGFAVVASDDDGGGDLDSLLPVDLGPLADRPAMLDMLRIRAKAYGGSSGSYRLTITPGMDARANDSWDTAE